MMKPKSPSGPTGDVAGVAGDVPRRDVAEVPQDAGVAVAAGWIRRRTMSAVSEMGSQPEDESMEEEMVAEPPLKRRAVAKRSPKAKAKAKAKGKSKTAPKAKCRGKPAVETDDEDATRYHGSPLAAAPGTPESVHKA